MWCGMGEQGPMDLAHSFIHSFIQQICIQCQALGLGERQAAARKQTVGLGASAIRNSGGRGGGRGRGGQAGPEEVTLS